MPIATSPEWQHLALYALAGAMLLGLVIRLPVIGRVARLLFSLALAALALFLLPQQPPSEPHLASLASRLGLDRQEVTGGEVRIRMAGDGHFWADASVNGVKRRMLIDSGATVTALSEETAAAAGVAPSAAPVPG